MVLILLHKIFWITVAVESMDMDNENNLFETISRLLYINRIGAWLLLYDGPALP